MSVFNRIITKLVCPKRLELKPTEIEIQIEWQSLEELQMSTYKIGDNLPGLPPEYLNIWISTTYKCPVCTPSGVIHLFPTFDDDNTRPPKQPSIWHPIYVQIVNGTINDIRTELPEGVAPSNIINEF